MANTKHIEILKQGPSAWNQWRRGNSTVWPDLSETNLTNANPANANLNKIKLKKAKLRKTNLELFSPAGF